MEHDEVESVSIEFTGHIEDQEDDQLEEVKSLYKEINELEMDLYRLDRGLQLYTEDDQCMNVGGFDLHPVKNLTSNNDENVDLFSLRINRDYLMSKVSRIVMDRWSDKMISFYRRINAARLLDRYTYSVEICSETQSVGPCSVQNIETQWNTWIESFKQREQAILKEWKASLMSF